MIFSLRITKLAVRLGYITFPALFEQILTHFYSSTSVVFSSTKRVLADIIHDSSLPRNHIARTGVIVLYDSKVRTLFEPSELQELIKREPPLPKLDEVFLTALKGYGSVSKLHVCSSNVSILILTLL